MRRPRILFATWTAPGHLFPMVPLAWAFQAAGAQVRLAAPPACRDAVLATGLPYTAVGVDVPKPPTASPKEIRTWGSDRPWPAGWAGRPELLDEQQTEALSWAAAKQVRNADGMVGDLVALARAWQPDLVVSDVLCFAGPVAAAAAGVPHLAQGWELGTTLGVERLRRRDDWLPGYAELFTRFGLEPRPCSEYLLDVSPPSMRVAESVPLSRTPMRYVPYNGTGRAPEWLAGKPRRPRVLVTTGVSLGRYDPETAGRMVRSFAEAVALPGVDLVIAAGAGLESALSELPPGARTVSGVPFHLLLPGCAAVVHHGGAGTALTAAAYGVPQLVLPQAPLYEEIADRVERAGAGHVLGPEVRESASEVRAGLERLLADTACRESLGALAAEIRRTPPPSEVAERLLAGAAA